MKKYKVQHRVSYTIVNTVEAHDREEAEEEAFEQIRLSLPVHGINVEVSALEIKEG